MDQRRTTIFILIAALCGIQTVTAQFEQVNSTDCDDDWEQWSRFGSYSGCDSSCDGMASRRRTRVCLDIISEQSDCQYVETEQETISCDDTSACQTNVDGGLGSWTNWKVSGGCSAYCGQGLQKVERTRKCDHPPPAGAGADCSGLRSQSATQPCNAYSFQCNFICSRFSNGVIAYPRRTGQYLQCAYGNVNWVNCQSRSVYQNQLNQLNLQFSWYNFNFNVWIERTSLLTKMRVCAARRRGS